LSCSIRAFRHTPLHFSPGKTPWIWKIKQKVFKYWLQKDKDVLFLLLCHIESQKKGGMLTIIKMLDI
jgi:hypothetical protein